MEIKAAIDECTVGTSPRVRPPSTEAVNTPSSRPKMKILLRTSVAVTVVVVVVTLRTKLLLLAADHVIPGRINIRHIVISLEEELQRTFFEQGIELQSQCPSSQDLCPMFPSGISGELGESPAVFSGGVRVDT